MLFLFGSGKAYENNNRRFRTQSVSGTPLQRQANERDMEAPLNLSLLALYIYIYWTCLPYFKMRRFEKQQNKQIQKTTTQQSKQIKKTNTNNNNTTY
jgi:hypothetical protein